MKQLHLTIQELGTAFLSYIRRVRYVVIALFAYIFVLHFHLFDTMIPGIDTEHLISSPKAMYDSWLGIGRQGLCLIKLLSGNSLYNPDFAAMLSLLLLIPVCLIVPFLGSLASGNTEGYPGESWLVFLFDALAVSHPVLTEQLYFTLQSTEVIFSLLLLELCLAGTHFWSVSRNPFWLLSTILVLQIPFSTYQAFVPLFITGAVGMVFLQSLFSPKAIREQLRYLGRFTLAFLCSFLLNQMISRFFFMDSTYLGEQFSWTEFGFSGGCLKILSHIRDIFIGNGTYYFIEFLLLCIVLLIIVLWHCLSEKKAGTALWQLFLLLAWFASPFYLSVLLGSRPVIRAQLVLPFSTAGTAFLCGYLFLHWKPFASRKVCRNIAGFLLILLCLDTVYQEASVTSRLYYTDTIRKQGDFSLALSLQQDIDAFTGESNYSGTVIFWGRRQAVTNPSCIQGDIMGQSFFDWDVDAEPHYYYSSNRIVDFLNSLGSSYLKPTAEQIEQAASLMDSVPGYPSPDSIIWSGDTVVIKLSEE